MDDSVESFELFPTAGIRAMSKEEILACHDTVFLKEREAFYEERAIVISTMLEFPKFPNSSKEAAPDWYQRARAALIHFRICRSRISRRIKDLQREKQQGTSGMDYNNPTNSRERREVRRAEERALTPLAGCE